MANNIIKRTWKQGGMVNIEDLRGSAFQAEDGGHTFLISGVDENGDALALSGTPAGVLLRADGQDVTLTCSVSDGVVSATLPANAYVVPGRIGITIFLTNGGQKTAIYAAIAAVATTSSGTVAPPAGADVVTLVNAIETAISQIPASDTNLKGALAPTYSTSAVYAVGSYAWYDGKLYKCTTAITSGETWTSAHWTLANLGSDVNDLKSAITREVKDTNATNGYAAMEYDLIINSSVKWATGGTHLIVPVFPGDSVSITANSNMATILAFLKEDKAAVSGESVPVSSQTGFTGRISISAGTTQTYTIPSDCYFLCFTKTYSTYTYTPAKVIVNGFDMFSGIRSAHNALKNGTCKYLSVTSSTAESKYSKLTANLPGNTFSYITGSWFTDAPSGEYWLFTMSNTESYAGSAIQFAVNMYSNILWIRQKKYSSGSWAWGDWVAMSDPANNIINKGTLANNSDFDSINANSIYEINSEYTYTNKPTSMTYGYVMTIKYSSSYFTQFAFSFDGHHIWTRGKLTNWSAWQEVVTESTYLVNKGVLANNSDLNDISENSVYGINSERTYSHLPGNVTSGYVVTELYGNGTSFIIQHFYPLNGSVIYSRGKQGSSGWTVWTANGYHDTESKYFAFGDSTTFGQIGGEASGVQSKYNYPACVGKVLSMKVENKAVTGQGLIKDWNTIQTNYIENLDMTGAKLITVGWSYNDYSYYSSMNFGSYTDTGDTTFIGKYFTIMKQFQQKCKDAKLILVTGYGFSNGTTSPVTKPTLTDQFTHNYPFADGNKTTKQIYDTLEEMCHLHGWSCVNQAKGTVFNQWNASELIGDQIHPTSTGYLVYGNHLAARIAALYQNIVAW